MSLYLKNSMNSNSNTLYSGSLPGTLYLSTRPTWFANSDRYRTVNAGAAVMKDGTIKLCGGTQGGTPSRECYDYDKFVRIWMKMISNGIGKKMGLFSHPKRSEGHYKVSEKKSLFFLGHL